MPFRHPQFLGPPGPVDPLAALVGRPLFYLARPADDVGIRINIQELARLTGLDADALGKALATRDDLRLKLARDVWSAIKLEISGTPSFVIDGRVYHGNIPPEIIRDAIQ